MGGSSHVFIICSPRARVGKTLAARLIAEYYAAYSRPIIAYDLEPFEPALAEFLPSLATRASLSDTRGQMALFDQLIMDDDRVKVLDLGQLALEKFFSVAFDIDFAGEARRRGISAVVMYVADQTTVAQRTYSALRDRFPEFDFVPIYNDSIARGSELRRHYPALGSGLSPLQIPLLSANVRAAIDRRPFSLADARHLPPMHLPQLQRDELQAFVKRMFRELRELDVALLMKNIKSTLTYRLSDTGT
jgi:hypothetical protein